jgi:hypothetical protein
MTQGSDSGGRLVEGRIAVVRRASSGGYGTRDFFIPMTLGSDGGEIGLESFFAVTLGSDGGRNNVAIRIAVVRRADSGRNSIDGALFAMALWSDS